MCTFDAPITRCELMRTMVITDQTQAQCAAEHECPAGTCCPLLDCFTGVEVPPVAVAPARRREDDEVRLAA